MTTRFSFRQREFARLYAQGLPAVKAAHAAGYAASTAETNAARLLNHPRVIAYIERRRDNVRTVEAPHLAVLNRRLYKMITDGDEQTVLKAAREVRSLLKIQLRYGAGLVDYPDEVLLPAERLTEDEHGELETRMLPQIKGLNDNKASQLLENESDAFLHNSAKLEETDTLPSGEAAFDVKLKPKLPEDAKSHEPVTVNFIPVPSPGYSIEEEEDDADVPLAPPSKGKRR